jgi:hypothetical protein
VLASQRELFVSPAARLKAIRRHPGNVLVVGKTHNDIYIVNIYKMQVYKHFHQKLSGCVQVLFTDT